METTINVIFRTVHFKDCTKCWVSLPFNKKASEAWAKASLSDPKGKHSSIRVEQIKAGEEFSQRLANGEVYVLDRTTGKVETHWE